MLLDLESLPLRDYHKAKRLMWDPQDIDFSQDQRDWEAASRRECDLIKRAVALFSVGEQAVTHDLSPLMIALKREGNRLEEEMFLTTQLFEEAKHVEFFDAFLRHVVGAGVTLEAFSGPNYRQLFAELSDALETLLTDSSPSAQVKAVSSYHMIVEGVLAETGYYGIFKALRTRGLMPGLTQGLEYVQRDEARHIAFGLHLLTRHIRQDHALWAVADGQLNKLLPLAQGVFTEVLTDFLPEIPFGVDINDMIQYAGRQYLARVNVLESARQPVADRSARGSRESGAPNSQERNIGKMPQALILEDDPTILMLFQEALAIGGFDTLTALNVPEAIKILDAHTPDVALIDMNMPGRPGTDVLKHIGQTPRLANVKRVVITANALVESRVEELGADLFLVKPVSVKELLTLVKRLVG